MPLDHYVTLGRSGLRVSPLCLGTMTFGPDHGWGSSVDESAAVLNRYLERGGNFIDTANLYTHGHSELILGEHLHGKRDRVVLATKFYSNLFPGDPNGGGAGAKSILGAVHESLRRLRTDYIDLLWMHAWDHHTPIEETMHALNDLVRSGKVRYIGFSDTPAWKCAEAQTIARMRAWAPLIALQIEYSLLERTVEGELIPMARDLGLGVTPWSPLKGGALSGKYTRASASAGTDKPGRAWAVEAGLKGNEAAYAIVDALIALASELGTTPARVALSWEQNRPGVTSTILGARTIEQLDANLGALGVTLSAAQTAKLDELSKPVLPFPNAMLARIGGIMHGGITVNGETAVQSPFALKPGQKSY